MGLFSIFSGKKAEKESSFSRIEAEDMIDQGFACKEIAEELGCTEQEVYRIKEAKKRREARLQNKNTEQDDTDEVTNMRKEIEKAKLQDTLAEIEHRNMLRQREREELEAADQEELIEEAQDNPDTALFSLLSKVLSKKPDIPIVAQTSAQPIQTAEQELPSDTINQTKIVDYSSNLEQIPKLISAVKSGLVSETVFVQKAQEFKLTAPQAEKLFDFVKKKL